MQMGSFDYGPAHPGPDPILASGHNFEEGPSLLFKAGLIALDDRGERWLYPGMIAACDAERLEDATYYVPYHSSATYGTYSDTAVGILRTHHDAQLVTYPVPIVVIHGSAIEPYCYTAESGFGNRGSIPAAVKSDLNRIMWRKW